MKPELTIWAVTAAEQLTNLSEKPLLQRKANEFTFNVHLLHDTLWVIVKWRNKDRAAFRTAYSPDGLKVEQLTKREDGAQVNLSSTIGEFNVDITFPYAQKTVLHYTVTFKASNNLYIPFWPKDVLMLGNKGTQVPAGDVHIRQRGIRTGVVYAAFKQPAEGSLLYFQNLTALNDYCQLTETSVSETVGGEWPEFGFSLPLTKEKPMPAGKKLTIADAFVSFSTDTPKDQFEIARQYLDHLAAIYLLLPRPDTKYQDYPDLIKRSIHDLEHNKGCWCQHSGCSYLNAYVCDYATPPEIMVQLAVLLPVWDYMDWSGEDLPFSNQIYENLRTFYSDELKTIKRWLPAAEDQLDESEEQKVPNTMDAWYLHHPLLNLGRMALKGDKVGKELFLNSVDFAIKVAHHFNYKWPVFYDMQSLKTLKEETQPGMGGEKDVAGVYAQVMLLAYDVTGKKRFLEEAEKAAQSLVQFGFDIFYQANNTTFSAKAMLRLYKETKKQQYLDLCYLHIANLFKNMAIWECNYGYGVNFPMFFGLFPLNDAPYLAVYEEQESFASMHELLVLAEGTDFLPSARLLLAEYVKYMIHRAVYYFPPMLPKEMLADETKTGEIDPKLWIALEDIYDGWEKAGAVGQEVYGAGLCFGIVPRHYIRIPGQSFMIYMDYPTGNKVVKNNTITINVLGSKELTCRVCIIKTTDGNLPKISVVAGNEQDQQQLDKLSAKKLPNEFEIHGEQTIIIKWND
ncbi:hypothetical protein GWR56_15465 [Mucilaginibacter sp. 14171R-50]|uniref:hypothetical protein n=1 Tax=Mucilaginibacter sp. 14171R-50 TaxID=2703789 RepID=UPI00138B3FDC|nr:hypothetical protein [Mucilaginibacter sp. 14171R-50]QHS56874.1 hypothetical protein GWR56_15465 [Mucilaginibacter sp. 14171R-50]